MTEREIRPTGAADASAASWAPQACTLSSRERPLRAAEFDTLFANSLRRVRRLAATRLMLTLDSGADAAARDLTAREAECCSFFTFTVTSAGDELQVAVEVPAAQAAVLDSLAQQAAAALAAA
jgi:hypothetical protein